MILDATCAHNLEIDDRRIRNNSIGEELLLLLLLLLLLDFNTFNLRYLLLLMHAHTKLYLDRKTIDLQPRCT